VAHKQRRPGVQNWKERVGPFWADSALPNENKRASHQSPVAWADSTGKTAAIMSGNDPNNVGARYYDPDLWTARNLAPFSTSPARPIFKATPPLTTTARNGRFPTRSGKAWMGAARRNLAFSLLWGKNRLSFRAVSKPAAIVADDDRNAEVHVLEAGHFRQLDIGCRRGIAAWFRGFVGISR